MTEIELGQVYLESSQAVFQKHKTWADQAICQLSDEQLRQPLGEGSNSVLVIIKHLAGNLLSRWTDFLTSDGEKPWRNRDQEFVDDFPDRTQALAYWEQAWNVLFGSLKALTIDDLQRSITIRGEVHSVPLAIQRSLGHCCYHVGQILMLARHLAGEDWRTITIPRGKSADYNQQVWGTDAYQAPTGE